MTESARARRLGLETGFTLIELLVVLILISVLAALAMVGVTRTRGRGLEAAAISALRTFHSAQDAFRATCGHGRDYATTLPQLRAADLISPDLASGPVLVKSGYTLTLTATAPGEAPDTCTQGETAAHWYASATPEQPHTLRGFATSDEDDIWQDTNGAAPVAPFRAGPTVSRVEPF